MHRITYLLTLTAVLALAISNSSAQNRWVKVYHDEIDAVGDKMIESYDLGYLLLGRFGHNYPKYLWLIKTDVNGEVLWEKTLGDGENAIVFGDMAEDHSGNIYLVGSTLRYEPQGDPLIIKINVCGEKEWCRIFYTENNNDFASCLTLTPEGDVIIVLMLSNPDHNIDRKCLAKLSPEGELLWKQCYTSPDTSQIGEDIYDIILTPDNGFLITGFSWYEDPAVPNLWWLHPYFLKTDSLGNFEWETVVFKETSLQGGIANNTVVSPDKQYYYSSISHYYHDPNLASPALVKLDMEGNIVGVHDVVSGYKEGNLSYAQFLNDSTLAADAGWGNTEDDVWSRAVLIDTLGNLINSTVLMQDFYTSILEVAYDGKLVYASNTYQNNQFDFYLTKLNQNLGQDSLYTRPFTYDSLCPYQIVSDTIVQDDCGLIVGIEEQGGGEAWGQGGMEAWRHGSMEIFPNPASGEIHVRWNMDDGRHNKDLTLEIYDIFGRTASAPTPTLPQTGEGENWVVNVSALPPGIYLAIVREGTSIVGSGKFLVVKR